MKKCSKCQIDKEVTAFYSHVTGLEGLSASCKQCKKITSDSWYTKNKQRKATTASKWAATHKEQIAKLNSCNYKKNLLENRAKRQQYHKEHQKEEKIWRQQYLNENPEIARNWTSKRRAAQLNRLPKWLTIADKEKIKSFYNEAAKLTQITGIPHEVDHIIPLCGKNVSGLHCPQNLQILTRSQNRSKGIRV